MVRRSKRSGMISGDTSAAPFSEMFRMVQSNPPPPNSIVPVFSARRRTDLRCSSYGTSMPGAGMLCANVIGIALGFFAPKIARRENSTRYSV
jgi:hypothetical protein